MYLYDESMKAKQFEPLQFHMHAPSEHTIDGYLYDLELHIVHKNEQATELSVIGIFFDIKKGGNQSNWFLEQLLEGNKEADQNGNWKAPKLDIKKLVDGLNNRKIYHYEGSLTTPPCSEIVQWIVVDDPQSISLEQLNFFRNKWSNNFAFARGFGNNRAVQPINGRTIYYHSSALSLTQSFIALIATSVILFMNFI